MKKAITVLAIVAVCFSVKAADVSTFSKTEEEKNDQHIYEDIKCLLDANLITLQDAQKIWAKHKKLKRKK